MTVPYSTLSHLIPRLPPAVRGEGATQVARMQRSGIRGDAALQATDPALHCISCGLRSRPTEPLRASRLAALTHLAQESLAQRSSAVPHFLILDRSLPVVPLGEPRDRDTPRRILECDIAGRASRRYRHGSKSALYKSVDWTDAQAQRRILPCRSLCCDHVACESELRRPQCGILQGRHTPNLHRQATPRLQRHNEWLPACRVGTTPVRHWRPARRDQPRRFRTVASASRAVFPPARSRIAARIACAASRVRSGVGSS